MPLSKEATVQRMLKLRKTTKFSCPWSYRSFTGALTLPECLSKISNISNPFYIAGDEAVKY
jgi:hypothetical protein